MTMASPQRTPAPPLRLVQDGDARAYDWEQLPLPAQRLMLVAPLVFGWSAAGAILAVLLGGGVARQVRKCSAHGPWVCCASHRRRFRETYGCRDCRADLLSWRPPAPAMPAVPAVAPGPAQAAPEEAAGIAATAASPLVINRRKTSRPRSLGKRPISRKARRTLEAEESEIRSWGVYAERPRRGNGIDGDCPPATEACPWIRCRHHNYLEVDEETGIVKINFPYLDVDEIGETCSLRVALKGAQPGERRGAGNTVPAVAKHLNLVEESARQILKRAVRKYAIGMGVDSPDKGTDEDDEVEDDADAGDGAG